MNPLARTPFDHAFWLAHALWVKSAIFAEIAISSACLYWLMKDWHKKAAEVVASALFWFFGFEVFDASVHNILLRYFWRP